MGLDVAINEQCLLNCLLKDNERILQIQDNYFLSDIGKILFDTIKNLYLNKIELNNNNIIIKVNSKNDKITSEFLDKLRNSTYKIEDFNFYYKSLKESYAKSNLNVIIFDKLSKELNTKGDLNVDLILDLKKEIDLNVNLIEGKEKDILDLYKLFESLEFDIINKSKYKDLYSTGDRYLDKLLPLKFSPGYITTIFASTGIGKSAFALNLINKQINRKIPSIYFSLENDRILTTIRLAAMRLKIPIDNFYNTYNEDFNLSDLLLKEIEEEKNRLENNNKFYAIDKSSLSLLEIEEFIKEIKLKMNVDYCVVTIDLLTMVEDFNTQLNASNIESSMDKLHYLARKLNVHFVIVVQANRQVENKKIRTFEDLDKLHPTLLDIKNSSVFAERSRHVIYLFRKKIYAQKFFPDDKETELMEDIIELGLLKHTTGGLFRLYYLYEPDICRITKIEDEIEDENGENNNA